MTIDPLRQAERRAPTPIRLARWLFSAAVYLYPRRFQAAFGDEMLEVFDMALEEALAQSSTALLLRLLRELGQLPASLLLEHLYERKKNMTVLPLNTHRELNTVRWFARGLSLLPVIFWLTLALFNEDFLAEITLPLILIGLLSVSLIVAWRWERIGGAVTSGGALLLFGVLLYQNLSADNMITSRWVLILVSASMAGFYLILGWLFLSIAQQEPFIDPPLERSDDVARARPGRRYLVVGLIGIIAVLLFAIPITTPVQQRFEAPPVTTGSAADIMRSLQAQGAVVGVGSIPIEQPFTSVLGEVLIVDNQEIQVFEYADVTAATAVASAIYYGNSPGWEQFMLTTDDAHLYQIGNVLLLYTGSEPAITRLLVKTFGEREIGIH